MSAPTLMLLAEIPREGVRRLEEAVSSAVSGGVDAVLLRDPRAPAATLLEAARALRALTRGRARLLVHSDDSAALGAEADGLHLPSCALGSPSSRPAAGMSLGFSVHSAAEAQGAAARGADYLLAGTIFPSSSHPGAEPAGLELLSALRTATTLPVVAIGGVLPENAAACLRAGASGVAARSPFARAADPGALARSYRAALESARPLELTVNGRPAQVSGPLSIAEFLAGRGLSPERVAVEHNLEIVPRSRYAQTALASGDRLEIVQMMAGG